MNNTVYLIPLAGLLALLFTYLRAQWVARQDPGTDRMKRIAGYITDGAMAFLRAEYSKLVWFVVAVAVLLAYQGCSGGDTAKTSAWIGLSFAVGALCSALAGFIGMKVATKANVRTAHAARTSLASALTVAFRGGSVMGMGVVGLGVLGLSSLFFVYHGLDGWSISKTVITVTHGLLLWRVLDRALSPVWAAAFTPRPPTWARISWARWKRASRRIIRSTPPPSPITWATTWATSPAWARICSKATWAR